MKRELYTGKRVCIFVFLFVFYCGLKVAESQYGASSPLGVPQAAPLTAKSAFELASSRAMQWQPDAVLSVARCYPEYSLDGEGRSGVWSFEFFSDRARSAAIVHVRNGQLTMEMTASTSRARIPISEHIIWNSKRIYETALQSAGNPNPNLYAISMALTQDPDGTAVWYVYFGDRNSRRNAFVERIHAKSGRLIDRMRQ